MINAMPAPHPRTWCTARSELTFVEQASQKGFTLIPLSFFLSGRIVKVELAVAKGKQTHDKRASIKERELERELRNLE
jgi:SsrA-binding protein